jgi:hypothetical protein
MSLNRMPIFVWSILVMSFMIVFAMPPLMVTSIMLAVDRTVGAHFFNPEMDALIEAGQAETDPDRRWEIYSEDDNDVTGYEYPCEIGRIDILAYHRDRKHWLVIELKRNQTSDETVGQILRYIAWVRRHLAGEGEHVEGVIIAQASDDRLHYALSETTNIRFLEYRVDFTLRESEGAIRPLT